MTTTCWRVWWRYGDDQWEVSSEALRYTEAEARYNAEHRQRLNPTHQIWALPDGEQPPPDEPFRPGPPEIVRL